MKNQCILKILVSVFLWAASSVSAESGLVCGIAEGYQPYQFQDTTGFVTGFDAEVVRLLCQYLDYEVDFYQAAWDDVVATFYHTDQLDFVAGMEINTKRKSMFKFTRPYYSRKIALFVLVKDSSISSVDDLAGCAITGDRDSAMEEFLAEIGLIEEIRLIQTPSKEQSFRFLKEQRVVGVIAPKAVGFYLANQIDMTVEILMEAKTESPVGLAFKKYDRALLKRFDKALEKLMHDGKLDSLYNRWYINNYR